MIMLTRKQAYLICDTHGLFSLLDDEVECDSLEEHNPDLLAAYTELAKYSGSVRKYDDDN